MNNLNIVEIIKRDLKASIDKDNIKERNKYFKEEIKYYGVSVATIRKIINEVYFQILDDSDIITASNDLIRSKVFEEKLAGIILLGYALKRKKHEFFDFSLIEEILDREINNWALCDTLSTDVIGVLLEIQPTYILKVIDWIYSKNPWKRRAAIVSIIKAKKLNNKEEIINNILEHLKYENNYFVKKALDWLKRENIQSKFKAKEI